MGMSSSQARFLGLTAKKNDLEFQAQQISQARTKLADKTDLLQAKYSEKMNNEILKYRNDDGTEQVLDYSCIRDNEKYFVMNHAHKKVVASADDIPEDENKSDYVVDPNIIKTSYFEESIRHGVFYIAKFEENSVDKKVGLDIAQVPEIHLTYDESDDQRALAEYELEMKKVQKEDKKLELQLNNIETEHKAIETEMESVQKVVDQNIENSFKTFG